MTRKILAAFLLAVPAIAAAQDSAVTPQAHLNDVISEILSYDPTVRSRLCAIEAEHSEAQAENMAASPEVEFEHLWGADQNRWSASVTQEIEWPWLYRSRSRQAGLERSRSEALLTLYAYDRALTLKLIIIDIINANRRCQLYKEIADNIDSIASATKASYDMGEATILDLRKAQIASVNAHADYRMALTDVTNIYESVSIFNVTAEIFEREDVAFDEYPMQPFEEPTEKFDEAWSPYQTVSLEAYRNRLKVANMSALPSFSVGYVHAFEDDNHFNGLKVSVTLPSFSRKKRIQAVRSRVDYDMIEDTANETAAINECQTQYCVAGQLKEELDQYAGLIDDNSYMELLKMAFDSGEMTVVDYITEINLFRQSRLTYLDLEYRYNLALTRSNRYRSIGF